jgi:hypothetical protein
VKGTMGLADRLKDLTTKAQDAVVEHNEDIHKAVEKVAATADERTGGKYHEHIQRVGAKAGGLIDGLKGTDTPPAAQADTPPAAQADTPPAAQADTPPAAAQADTPAAAQADTPP